MSYNLVVTKTPLRISFAGGGTDFSGFYLEEGGEVVSTAIDKYLYVTAKRHDARINSEKYRLNYFESEHVDRVTDIKNNIIRTVLQFLDFDAPLYISTVADIPASSGLGSSSAFAVGLLNAIHTIKGDSISLPQLAEEACHIEIECLKSPIGKQDQYATACGNLNRITFGTNDHVNIENIGLNDKEISNLFDHLLFFSTKISRSANDILSQQHTKTEQKLNFENLRTIKAHSQRAVDILRNTFNAAVFGGLLDETWQTKKQLSDDISNSDIDRWYNLARRAGAYGGKILGAGGGGYFLLVVEPENQDAVRNALSELIEVDISYEPLGTRVILAQ